MGIVQTNRWIEKDFEQPIKMCEKLVPYFNKQNANEIYKQLRDYGMYRPSRATWDTVNFLIEEKVWDQINGYFETYRKKWSGPDIPIFIFPLDQSRGLFLRRDIGKSGVSFPDKIFLFLPKLDDPMELEALFIHEYHHVCRLNKLNRTMDDYTLLDSMIIEGLAEYAVLKNCGKKYLAKWCSMYEDNEVEILWEKYIKNYLNSKKRERIHDDILYGNGRIPKLLGYAVGFLLVHDYYEKIDFSTRQSFSISSRKFVEGKI